MSEFETKREAEEAILKAERTEALFSHRGSKTCDDKAEAARAEAARIRDLLPTLPEGK